MFRDPMFYVCMYIWNILCTFHVAVSGYGTIVSLRNKWIPVCFSSKKSVILIFLLDWDELFFVSLGLSFPVIQII